MRLLNQIIVLLSVFLRNLHTAFHSDCTNLHSHEQCKGSLFSKPFPAFVIYRQFDDSHFDKSEVIHDYSFHLHFSNKMNYIEHLFMWLLGICKSSFKNACLDLLPIVSDCRLFLLCLALIDHKCVSLFLGILFLSSDWYICFYICTLLFLLL